MTSNLIVHLFEDTTANRLFTHFNHLSDATVSTSPTTSSSDLLLFQQVISQCVLQLLLIHVLDDVLKIEKCFISIPLPSLLKWCDCLESSWEFAHKFNEHEALRFNLWKAGFMKQRPNLHKQETTSIMSLINVLLKMMKNKMEIEDRTSLVIERLIKTYLQQEQNNEKRQKNAVKPAIEMVLEYFIEMDEELFDRIGKSMYKSFVWIARLENDEIIRAKVCDVLNRYMIYL